MSKCVTMYEENKPSTLINDTRWGGHFFRAILVRSAMPNNKIYLINIWDSEYERRYVLLFIIYNSQVLVGWEDLRPIIIRIWHRPALSSNQITPSAGQNRVSCWLNRRFTMTTYVVSTITTITTEPNACTSKQSTETSYSHVTSRWLRWCEKWFHRLLNSLSAVSILEGKARETVGAIRNPAALAPHIVWFTTPCAR